MASQFLSTPQIEEFMSTVMTMLNKQNRKFINRLVDDVHTFPDVDKLFIEGVLTACLYRIMIDWSDTRSQWRAGSWSSCCRRPQSTAIAC